MKYSVSYTKQFEKQLKICNKRGLDISLLSAAVSILEECGILPPSYKPHKLNGKYKGLWECHLKPDWLLVWEQRDNEFILVFTATGSHSDLFYSIVVTKGSIDLKVFYNLLGLVD